MNRLFVILSGIFLWLFLTACHDPDRQLRMEQVLLENRLKERLDMARKQRIDDCDKRLMAAALLVVDSIRLQEIKAGLDTVSRPYVPTKPAYPGPGKNIDSLEVKPLLSDSIVKKK
jgi:hypothetical protein